MAKWEQIEAYAHLFVNSGLWIKVLLHTKHYPAHSTNKINAEKKSPCKENFWITLWKLFKIFYFVKYVNFYVKSQIHFRILRNLSNKNLAKPCCEKKTGNVKLFSCTITRLFKSRREWMSWKSMCLAMGRSTVIALALSNYRYNSG